MADNSSLPVASGNETFANEDISSVKYPTPKLAWGPNGTANRVDTASGKSLPIQVRSATGLIPIGEPTDAKSTATDTTSATGISIWKQISASLQSLAAKSGYTGSATFTTGTTAYAANDVVGAASANAALDFGVVGVSAGNIMVTSVELEIDGSSIISGETSYNLYLYNVTPPSAINDSSAFDIPSGDRASLLGKIFLPNVIDEGSTLYCALDGINKQVLLAGTHLFGYLVSVGAFTPSARVYKITIHTVDL